MIEAPHRTPSPPAGRAPATRLLPGPHSCLAIDLRELASDLAGPVDRDELTAEEALRLSEILDEVVEEALPLVVDIVGSALGPRVESLPLHARLALANARLRQLVGAE